MMDPACIFSIHTSLCMMFEVTNAVEIVRNVAATRNQSAQFSFLAAWGIYCQQPNTCLSHPSSFQPTPKPLCCQNPDTEHREHSPNNKRSKRRSRGTVSHGTVLLTGNLPSKLKKLTMNGSSVLNLHPAALRSHFRNPYSGSSVPPT